jgi:DnaJ-class molecular chaperone
VKDYYRILGVDRLASADDIKRAYRRLASQHHPDRGGDTAQFQEIQEAYSILSDQQRRSEYDNPQQRVHVNMGGAGNFDLDSLFQMFGTNFRPQRSNSARLTLWIGISDVVKGGPRVVSLQLNNTVTNVEIDVPPGIDDGDTIRYPGLAPGGQDLVITYRIRPDPRIERQGQNVTITHTVSVWDLLLGADVQITDLSDTTVILTVPPRTQPGSLLRLRGKGIPGKSLPGYQGRPPGDLLVRIGAKFPDTISEELLSAVNKELGR